MKVPVKIFYVTMGWVFLILALLGVALPLLPTTPFAILSAYFFSRGSETMHKWLVASPVLGDFIVDWYEHGMIKLTAKIWSTVMIVLLFSYTLIFVPVAYWIKAIVLLSGVGVLSFIWTRPSKPKKST